VTFLNTVLTTLFLDSLIIPQYIAMRILSNTLNSTALIGGLIVILTATLYPFRFCFNEHHNLFNSFKVASALEARGTDLLIGVDGAHRQPYRGMIDEIRIYRRVLSASEINQEEKLFAAGLSEKSHRVDNLKDGLVASLSFDEKSGTLVKDDSGSGNNGQLMRQPKSIEGRMDGALSFDGSGQWVQVPNSPSLDISGDAITVSVWVNLVDSNDGIDQVILGKPWKANSMDYPFYQYGVEFDSDGKKGMDFYFDNRLGQSRGPYRMKVPLGVWTHVAFTYDGGVVRGYVDGKEQLSTNTSELWRPADFVLNILLFVPFGFGLEAILRRKRLPVSTAIPFSILIGAILSLSVEILQVWLPGRYPSLIDVSSNTLGTLIGSVVFLLLSFRQEVRNISANGMTLNDGSSQQDFYD